MILNINNLIQLTLSPGIAATDGDILVTEFCSYFTTEMTPMCASVLDVRRIVGAFVTEIPDDVINQLILEYSICAQDLADCPIDDKWKRYANKWVSYKVALIIMYNTTSSSSGDTAFKQLGDFSISNKGSDGSSSGPSKMIDWLECEAFKFEFSIRECVDPAMNCLGLTDNNALPYKPTLPGLTEKGGCDLNKPVVGRRWVTDFAGAPRGNNEIQVNKRKYKTNLGTRYIYGSRPI